MIVLRSYQEMPQYYKKMATSSKDMRYCKILTFMSKFTCKHVSCYCNESLASKYSQFCKDLNRDLTFYGMLDITNLACLRILQEILLLSTWVKCKVLWKTGAVQGSTKTIHILLGPFYVFLIVHMWSTCNNTQSNLQDMYIKYDDRCK